MGVIINRSLMLTTSLFLILDSSTTKASSRGRSTPRSTTVKYQPSQAHGDDFLLQYLKVKSESESEDNDPEETQRKFYEWVPDGSLMSAVPPDCLPEYFENIAQKQKMPAAEFGRLTQNYFDRCGGYLSAHATGGLAGLIDYAVASYPFLENSKIHSQTFETKDGRVLNGFVGIKDQTPRPWIIYKCGVFCAAEPNAVTLKNYVIHLFDQSPFNVIFLGNRTGQDYISTNQVFNFGGYFESQDFFDIAHWLREESEYQDLVSSVHVVAVSLGGSAAYLTEKKINSDNNHSINLIQSVTSLCAVSDLRPTVENMYDDNLKGKIFTHFTWQSLQDSKSALTKVADLIGDDQPESQEFPNLLGKLVSRFMPTLGSDTEKEKIFWHQSNYSDKTRNAEVPLFVWASEDDSIVDFNINTGRLFNENSERPDPNMAIVKVPMGEHCGFATAYGYPTTASVLRSFILNNSPEYQINQQQQKKQNRQNLTIPIEILPNLIQGEQIISYWWAQDSQLSDSINLKMEIYGADDSLCPEEWAFEGTPNCIREAKFAVKNSLFETHDFIIPHNPIEKEILIRELNAKTSLNFNGKTIVGSNHGPNQIFIRY